MNDFDRAEAQHEHEHNIMEGYIVLPPTADLVALVKLAYELSAPQGLGFLHFREGGLSDDEARALVHPGRGLPVNLDYVHGRAVKLTVTEWEGVRYVPPRWYDHSPVAYGVLLAAAGVDAPVLQSLWEKARG